MEDGIGLDFEIDFSRHPSHFGCYRGSLGLQRGGGTEVSLATLGIAIADSRAGQTNKIKEIQFTHTVKIS